MEEFTRFLSALLAIVPSGTVIYFPVSGEWRLRLPELEVEPAGGVKSDPD